MWCAHQVSEALRIFGIVHESFHRIIGNGVSCHQPSRLCKSNTTHQAGRLRLCTRNEPGKILVPRTFGFQVKTIVHFYQASFLKGVQILQANIWLATKSYKSAHTVTVHQDTVQDCPIFPTLPCNLCSSSFSSRPLGIPIQLKRYTRDDILVSDGW